MAESPKQAQSPFCACFELTPFARSTSSAAADKVQGLSLLAIDGVGLVDVLLGGLADMLALLEAFMGIAAGVESVTVVLAAEAVESVFDE
jgi:hypothetical protein